MVWGPFDAPPLISSQPAFHSSHCCGNLFFTDITSLYPILATPHSSCFLPRDSSESYKISLHSHSGRLEVWGSHPIGWPSTSGRQVPMNICSPLPSWEWFELGSMAPQKDPARWSLVVCCDDQPPHTLLCWLSLLPLFAPPVPPFQFPRIALPKKLSASSPALWRILGLERYCRVQM